MEKKLQSFLNSDLIEKYVLGDTSRLQDLEVEYFLSKYQEANDEYEKVQNSLQILCMANAVKAPKKSLQAVLAEVEANETKVLSLSDRSSTTPWYSIAASIVALLFAGSSFMLYQHNQALLHENDVVVEEVFDLRNDIVKNNERMDNLMHQFMKLNNPDTEKYVLKGNDRAKDLKTVAYINSVEKTSMIDIVTLPQLPEEQYYQMWAELQDRMVNLGILDESERKLQSIPYLEDALGLTITIESKGDAIESTAENSVAEISLKNN